MNKGRMAIYTFKEALEKTLKEFATYLFSFLAAIAINQAVQHELAQRAKRNRWVYVWAAFCIVCLSIAMITVITYVDPSDREVGE